MSNPTSSPKPAQQSSGCLSCAAVAVVLLVLLGVFSAFLSRVLWPEDKPEGGAPAAARVDDAASAEFASWLQRGSWECVNATIPLMKGATFTFGDGTLTIRGGEVSVTRTFRVGARERMNGREIYNVRVDDDDLIIMTATESVPGTDHFSMTWGSDGSASLGLGRRAR